MRFTRWATAVLAVGIVGCSADRLAAPADELRPAAAPSFDKMSALKPPAAERPSAAQGYEASLKVAERWLEALQARQVFGPAAGFSMSSQDFTEAAQTINSTRTLLKQAQTMELASTLMQIPTDPDAPYYPSGNELAGSTTKVDVLSKKVIVNTRIGAPIPGVLTFTSNGNVMVGALQFPVEYTEPTNLLPLQYSLTRPFGIPSDCFAAPSNGAFSTQHRASWGPFRDIGITFSLGTSNGSDSCLHIPTSVVVTLNATELSPGEGTQANAVAYSSNGQPFTDPCNWVWSSSYASTSVSSTGYVKAGRGPIQDNIRASCNGVAGQALISIKDYPTNPGGGGDGSGPTAADPPKPAPIITYQTIPWGVTYCTVEFYQDFIWKNTSWMAQPPVITSVKCN